MHRNSKRSRDREGAFFPTHVLLYNQAHLARIHRRDLLHPAFEIVVIWIETPDQRVQPQGRVPDLKHQAASRATAPYGPRSIHRGVVSLVAGAAAVEFAGSDLHRFLTPYISRPRRCDEPVL